MKSKIRIKFPLSISFSSKIDGTQLEKSMGLGGGEIWTFDPILLHDVIDHRTTVPCKLTGSCTVYFKLKRIKTLGSSGICLKSPILLENPFSNDSSWLFTSKFVNAIYVTDRWLLQAGPLRAYFCSPFLLWLSLDPSFYLFLNYLCQLKCKHVLTPELNQIVILYCKGPWKGQPLLQSKIFNANNIWLWPK